MTEKMRSCLILFLLFLFQPLLISDVWAAERTQPIRIGALTDSWGPTPGVVGLRDGLKELGYRENHDFAIGSDSPREISLLFPKLRESS